MRWNWKIIVPLILKQEKNHVKVTPTPARLDLLTDWRYENKNKVTRKKSKSLFKTIGKQTVVMIMRANLVDHTMIKYYSMPIY